MRIPVVLVALAAFAFSGCFSARQATAPSRDTPSGTVEMFKLYARKGDPAGEWDVLSPGLKQRISQQAGRKVDEADYIQYRKSLRRDTRVRAAENILQTAVVVNTQQVDANTVFAFVRTSGGPLAKSARIRMIRLTRWALYTTDSSEPFWGHSNDPLFGIESRPDGSYVIWSRTTPGGPRNDQVIPASQVRDFKQVSQWYVDDLGGLEKQFMG